MPKRERNRGELIRPEESFEISPFREMERYFDELFRHPFSLFGYPAWKRGQLARSSIVSPTVDIFEDGNDVVVKAEIPGITKDDLKVDITDDSITISGEKKQEKEVNREDYHRLECSYGSFRRSFRLPETVESDKAKATFRDGILEIRMPKSETSKKRRITID